jgi:hypothetical protein
MEKLMDKTLSGIARAEYIEYWYSVVDKLKYTQL